MELSLVLLSLLAVLSWIVPKVCVLAGRLYPDDCCGVALTGDPVHELSSGRMRGNGSTRLAATESGS